MNHKNAHNRAPVRDYLLPTSDGGITTDNASNMIAMGRVLKDKMYNEFNNQHLQHFHCGAHILNIIVEEGIKLISKEISKAREFSMKLRNSLSLIRELKQIFEMSVN
ncbi:7794_t:CDS:2, partial [Racocetra fulgida]